MLQLMPELWASQWKEGGVAGKRACHGSSVCYPKGSLWDCEPVAIAHLWLLFTQFICEWTPWEILPGLYVYAKLLPYKTKWKFKFCIPTYNLFVTCKKKKLICYYLAHFGKFSDFIPIRIMTFITPVWYCCGLA